MASTITTTIRWEPEELADVKSEAKRIGLPVALFIKSLALKKVRGIIEVDASPELIKELEEAEKEIENGEYETFDSMEELLDDLSKYIKKK